MSYVIIRENEEPSLYSIDQLKKDNPNTSFPEMINNELLSDWGVFPLITIESNYNPDTHILIGWEIINENGNWIRRGNIIELSLEELDKVAIRKLKDIEDKKRLDYMTYSDPLYFKWQAGECTELDWLNAREMVKSWYIVDPTQPSSVPV